jgi:hypothetical protein
VKVAGPVPSFILLLESRSNVQWDSDAGHFLFACYHSFLASCAALFRLLCLHCSAFSGSDRHAIIVQPGLLLALCISELIFGVLLWQASINYSNFGKQSMSQEVHLLGIQEFHASLPLSHHLFCFRQAANGCQFNMSNNNLRPIGWTSGVCSHSSTFD